MQSLSDITEFYIKACGSNLTRNSIEIIIDIAPDMPKVFEEKIPNPITYALSQLTLEVEDAKSSKCLYQTKLEDNVQKLMIYHNGRSIPISTLENLNSRLRDIAEKKVRYDSWRHGNLIAARFIQELDGELILENISGDYKVLTTVKIPLKY